MSRSRKRARFGRCCCGAALVRFSGHVNPRRGTGIAGCPNPMMENVHSENDKLRKFKAKREGLA